MRESVNSVKSGVNSATAFDARIAANRSFSDRDESVPALECAFVGVLFPPVWASQDCVI